MRVSLGRFDAATVVTAVALLDPNFAGGHNVESPTAFVLTHAPSPKIVRPQDRVWALGRKLFFDPRLSASGSSSCATCHQPTHGWTDGRPKAVGDTHRPLAFRTPTLLNAADLERLGWTGRFADVEDVTFFAMSSPKNMGLPVADMLARLRNDATYAGLFRTAFSDGAVSKENVGSALDRFVRSIKSDVAPFDRWAEGDAGAINSSAARGFALFVGKGQCSQCHRGWAFTDGSFHDVGIGRGADVGRGAMFKSSLKLQYAFKTPTLRDVAVRGPYMHDGSLSTLRDVVDHYDKGGIDRPSRAAAIRPLHLSKQERDDLVAFLETLTGKDQFVARRRGASDADQ